MHILNKIDTDLTFNQSQQTCIKSTEQQILFHSKISLEE